MATTSPGRNAAWLKLIMTARPTLKQVKPDFHLPRTR